MEDRWITEQVYWDEIKDKLLHTFQNWFNKGGIPQYVRSGRIIPLCKDSDSGGYPEYGRIRTITVLCAITKHKRLIKAISLCFSDHVREFSYLPGYYQGINVHLAAHPLGLY